MIGKKSKMSLRYKCTLQSMYTAGNDVAVLVFAHADPNGLYQLQILKTTSAEEPPAHPVSRIIRGTPSTPFHRKAAECSLRPTDELTAETKSSKPQSIGATDNSHPTYCSGDILVRDSRTHPTHSVERFNLSAALSRNRAYVRTPAVIKSSPHMAHLMKSPNNSRPPLIALCHRRPSRPPLRNPLIFHVRPDTTPGHIIELFLRAAHRRRRVHFIVAWPL
ncbi:hypothetical protein EVAR_19487_1 [Eumeta japonica]|uniref:Uncharacterized protein n=1 Tax=Eumeta variegata TaxID=151549 RepID=A0A4C1V9A2_EUMVA|nr:hypothetical protein EVAR_19487_1 [Eumeta japonica]